MSEKTLKQLVGALVVAAALFLRVLYFSYLYVSQEGQIAQAEQRLSVGALWKDEGWVLAMPDGSRS